MDKVSDQSRCRALVGNIKVIDIAFPDDAVLLVDYLKVLVMAVEVLHEEAKPQKLYVLWTKIEVQLFSYEWMKHFSQSIHLMKTVMPLKVSITWVA